MARALLYPPLLASALIHRPSLASLISFKSFSQLPFHREYLESHSNQTLHDTTKSYRNSFVTSLDSSDRTTHLFTMSSREAYQVPSANQVPIPGRDLYNQQDNNGPAINYLCGDCNAKVPLKRGDPIRCKECGHRVLYKERTKR